MNMTIDVNNPDALAAEIIHQDFGGVDPVDILRSSPHEAGRDLFSDRPIHVFVDLGRRPAGEETNFMGGGFISVSDVDEQGMPSWGLDFSEEDAVKLMGALALAVHELRTHRATNIDQKDLAK